MLCERQGRPEIRGGLLFLRLNHQIDCCEVLVVTLRVSGFDSYKIDPGSVELQLASGARLSSGLEIHPVRGLHLDIVADYG